MFYEALLAGIEPIEAYLEAVPDVNIWREGYKQNPICGAW